jgi:aspartate racemase
MGPEATASFYARLIASTPARCDQEHLHVIIDADPGVPDRTAALLGEGESPLPRMRAAIQRLVSAGVQLIAIPCNTAHAWLPDLREGVQVPLLDMVEETVAEVARELSAGAAVGLMATTGTARSGLYAGALARQGLELLPLDEDHQNQIMGAIGRIKAGRRGEARDPLLAVARMLIDRGAQAIILGCTEIPLVVGPSDLSVPVFDSLEILAAAVVTRAHRP